MKSFIRQFFSWPTDYELRCYAVGAIWFSVFNVIVKLIGLSLLSLGIDITFLTK